MVASAQAGFHHSPHSQVSIAPLTSHQSSRERRHWHWLPDPAMWPVWGGPSLISRHQPPQAQNTSDCNSGGNQRRPDCVSLLTPPLLTWIKCSNNKEMGEGWIKCLYFKNRNQIWRAPAAFHTTMFPFWIYHWPIWYLIISWKPLIVFSWKNTRIDFLSNSPDTPFKEVALVLSKTYMKDNINLLIYSNMLIF